MYAADATITVGPVITVTSTKPAVKKQDMRPVTFKEFFMQYCNRVGYGVPQIYTQLTLKMTGIARGDQVYSAMQKCVYLGFVSNTTTSYKWNSPVTPKFINILISQNMHTDADLNEDSLTITRADLAKVINTLPNYQMLMSIGTQTNRGAKRNYQSPLINADGFDTLTQIYQLFKSDYRSGDKASDSVLVQGAIKGMTDSVGDIHTEYFPPAEASQFNDTLNGSFEGIGGYLDVSSGQVTVTSLIKDSPAQKAGVQAGDHIIKVDGYVIQPTDTLQSIVARIK